jgi:hypothetical protein
MWCMYDSWTYTRDFAHASVFRRPGEPHQQHSEQYARLPFVGDARLRLAGCLSRRGCFFDFLTGHFRRLRGPSAATVVAGSTSACGAHTQTSFVCHRLRRF